MCCNILCLYNVSFLYRTVEAVAVAVETPAVPPAAATRSPSPSDRLSLSPSSLDSSPVNSHRKNSVSGRQKDKVGTSVVG